MRNLFIITGILCALLNFTRAYGSSFYYTPSPSNEIIILIISQDTTFHRHLSENLRSNILKQSQTIVGEDFSIRAEILHEITNHPGYWTILLVLPRLIDAKLGLISSRTKWIIFCEDTTIITIKPLLSRLLQENHTEIFYLGHALHDREATVIHHYAFFGNPSWFPYPLMSSGVIFTSTMIKRIAQQVQKMGQPRTEFSIDASYELALFIMENIRVDDIGHFTTVLASETAETTAAAMNDTAYGGNNNNNDNSMKTNTLEHGEHVNALRNFHFRDAAFICSAASFEQQDLPCFLQASRLNSSASLRVRRISIYFAIKTYHKYHQERIPVIENTWGFFAVHKRYFSDVEDKAIPTTITGVPNAETGHCSKTLSILKLALKDIESLNRYQRNEAIQWLFLSDDDTLLSVAGVCDILGHFNSSDDIYLGERYGYRLYAKDGFNYITGGGGIALSLPIVKKIIRHCTCPAITAPDDMVLGSCMHTLQVKVIHSSRFHQGRPFDYPPALLQIEKPISFHKFWQLDPEAIYKEWFADDDKRNAEHESSLTQKYSHLKDLRSPQRRPERQQQSKTRIHYTNEILQRHQIKTHLYSEDRHLDL